MRLAARYLERQQSPEGFVSLLETNVNSPPDTAFVVHTVASCAAIGKRLNLPELIEIPRAFLQRAGAGLTAAT